MKQLLLFMLCPLLMFGQTQIGQDIDGEAFNDFVAPVFPYHQMVV